MSQTDFYGENDCAASNKVGFSGNNLVAARNCNVVRTHCCSNSAMSQNDRSDDDGMGDKDGSEDDRDNIVEDYSSNDNFSSCVIVGNSKEYNVDNNYCCYNSAAIQNNRIGEDLIFGEDLMGTDDLGL